MIQLTKLNVDNCEGLKTDHEPCEKIRKGWSQRYNKIDNKDREMGQYCVCEGVKEGWCVTFQIAGRC